MPFKSEKQRRYLYKNEPAIAKKWTKKNKEEEKIMDDLVIIDKLKKRINATLQQIGDNMITGGVDSMEKYKYLLGQAQAYQIVIQEISNLLNKDEKEQNDGNVIDIKGSTKN
jgi:hypothetical protein